jgi:hypothetical protein
MSEKLFQNYTRGPAQSGVDGRETSPFTGPLKPQLRPEMQPAQPMNVEHAPNAGSKD